MNIDWKQAILAVHSKFHPDMYVDLPTKIKIPTSSRHIRTGILAGDYAIELLLRHASEISERIRQLDNGH
jgi:hypothetical protein